MLELDTPPRKSTCKKCREKQTTRRGAWKFLTHEQNTRYSEGDFHKAPCDLVKSCDGKGRNHRCSQGDENMGAIPTVCTFSPGHGIHLHIRSAKKSVFDHTLYSLTTKTSPSFPRTCQWHLFQKSIKIELLACVASCEKKRGQA